MKISKKGQDSKSEGTGKSISGQSGRSGKVVMTTRGFSGKVEGVVNLAERSRKHGYQAPKFLVEG